MTAEPAKTTQHLFTLLPIWGMLFIDQFMNLTDTKWKDIGEHLSQTFWPISSKRKKFSLVRIVISLKGVTYFAATQGQPRFERKELSPWRTYRSKSTKYAKLKDQDDRS